MLRFRLATLVFIGCLCGGSVLTAAESASSFLDATDTTAQETDRLARAWSEYGLSNWELAAGFFRQVIGDSESTPAARLQAEFGLVYIEQYKMPGFSPEIAFMQYSELLTKVAPNTPDHAVIRKQMAECLLDQRTPDFTAARAYLREILDSPITPSLTRAAAVMELARSYILEGMAIDDDAGKDQHLLYALAVITQYRPTLDATSFSAAAHQLAGELAVLLGDYDRAVRELTVWLDKGIRSIRLRASTLFRIARISEIELGDDETAAAFYRRLAEEVPSDMRAFWARQRVEEIEDGKENRFARPPLTRLPKRDIREDLAHAMKTLFGDDAHLPLPEADDKAETRSGAETSANDRAGNQDDASDEPTAEDLAQ